MRLRYGCAIMLGALLVIAVGGCACSGEDLLENGEYKPAIMVDGQVFWLAPSGNIDRIPEGCEIIGQIEKISVPTNPPETDWEAIGFSEDFLGADIYQSEDGASIYVYSPEDEQYIPFELITE